MGYDNKMVKLSFNPLIKPQMANQEKKTTCENFPETQDSREISKQMASGKDFVTMSKCWEGKGGLREGLSSHSTLCGSHNASCIHG